MSTDDLIAERASIGDQTKQLGARIASMNGRMGAINKELQRRQRNSDNPEITDHAVLRYLERARGLDVAAIRAEMAALIASATHEKRDHGKGALRNGDLLFLRRDRRIQTVFRVDEIEETGHPMGWS